MEVFVSGVQTLSETGVTHVPSQYIQPPQDRPHQPITTSSSDSLNIPIIDLFNFNPQHSNDVRAELGRACSDWGAFQITNHGISNSLIKDMIDVGLTFFSECSITEKSKYSCDPNSAASEGYGSRMLVKEDSVLDWRDYFDHHTFPLSRRNPNRWPDFPTNYRGVVEEYSNQIKELALKLMSMISENLGLQSSCIEHIIGEVYQNITISYYPPCPQPELTLGLQSHSDIGAITLLIQDDVGGLEVLKDEKWVTVQPVSDAIVVILADQTEIMTNGKYRSAVHRAVSNSHRARLSVGTFHDPGKIRRIAPAAQLVDKDTLARYKEVVYGEYVSNWYSKGPEGKRNIDFLLIDPLLLNQQ
ncbi:hypothetical protein C5167_039711 [Papaver somniferum]|uniref:Fe2OG dioxygenase domain-containing protein n=1 Tax=Papaver somniferum TaxID=3469 RepID=A0A4Y7ICW6_PAPSO|nr:probable 2-oxoglutarate-dependent dioxygenase ANS [Papaver somniferum]RZC46767.1 hypothetical protein C5167_039711 [Papaver somniferum]